MMNLYFVQNQRGLPFVKIGMKVEIEGGQTGIITGGNSSGNIDVKLDGQKHSVNCHPTYMIKYFNEDGSIIKEFKN